MRPRHARPRARIVRRIAVPLAILLAVALVRMVPALAGESPGRATGGPAATDPEVAARDDLIKRLQGNPVMRRPNLTATNGKKQESMDTAQFLDIDGAPYAVYSPGSKGIALASAPGLDGPWTRVGTLDDDYASQPFLYRESDGSFLLADEWEYRHFEDQVLNTGVQFKHFADVAAMKAGRWDKILLVTDTLSRCTLGTGREGTPDIHGVSADGKRIDYGFHYNSDCGGTDFDREGYGRVTDFGTVDNIATTTADTVRDQAMLDAGFPGKHGGRNDITWHGYRFSLQEAQNTTATGAKDPKAYLNWRLSLYDYTDHRVYPVTLNDNQVTCAANPKITEMPGPGGRRVLAVGAFIFGECAAPNTKNQTGELLYLAPAT